MSLRGGTLEASAARHQAQLSDTRREQDAAVTRVTAVRGALSDWESGIAARDPEWPLKREPFMRYALALRSERGLPQDEATAVQWANEALAEVNKLFSSARPTPRPTAPTPRSGITPASRAAPEPKSMMQAAQLALQRMRA